MVVALIPVKSLANAKSRLATILPSDHREAIVVAMLLKVLGECALCTEISRICVVTSDDEIARIARAHDSGVVLEPADAGLNCAVEAGLHAAADLDVQQILILPADIPFLDQPELRRILESSDGHHQSAIVPCRNGRGTNALLIPSNANFTPQFGDGSFQRHFRQLSDLGLAPRALHLPGIAADIDEPDDLMMLSDTLTMPSLQALVSPDGSARWQLH